MGWPEMMKQERRKVPLLQAQCILSQETEKEFRIFFRKLFFWVEKH